MKDLECKITSKISHYHCPHTNIRYPENAEAVRCMLAEYFYGLDQVLRQWDILVWGLEYKKCIYYQ